MREDNVCSPTASVKRTWYNNQVFPLVPFLKVKQAGEYNTKGFTFHWLFFKVWTLDSFEFELGIVCSSHWGLGVIGILPYLRRVVTIPFPFGWKGESWMQRNLWRKPKA